MIRPAAAEPGAVQDVRHADLVRGKPVQNRRRDFVPRQPHERAGRLVGAHGVHEDDIARVLEVRKERQPERSAVEDERPLRRLPVTVEPRDRGRPQSVVAAEQVS